MSIDNSEQSRVENPAISLWRPNYRCRRWLLIGLIMLAADLVLGLLATALEFRHWGEDGFSPDVVVAYVAIIPQIVFITSYLVLAREAGERGLWKSAAGMLGSYLVMCLLSIVFMEVLPEAGNTAITVAAAAGIVALLAFSISGIPRFTNQVAADQPPSPASETASSGDGGFGWLGGIAAFIAFVVMRAIVRRFIMPVFGARLGIDDWALIECVAIIAFGLTFAVWFAITKIRLRRKLGAMACVIGTTEILIILVHVGMAAVILCMIMTEAAAAPQLDDAGIEKLLDPWMKRGSLTSATCHVVWVVVTAAFFFSLRQQSEQDGSEAFVNSRERWEE
jgi:hypothetical protein